MYTQITGDDIEITQSPSNIKMNHLQREEDDQ
jgi:hypothetical protein